MLFLFFATAPFTVPPEQPHQVVVDAQTLDVHIPVVDMSDYFSCDCSKGAFLDTLEKAMKEVGFFAVRNTGVNRGVIDKAYSQAQQFFKQSPAFKEMSFSPVLKGQRGFVPGETAKGNQAKDCKEFYHIGRELPLEEGTSFAPNIWPEQAYFKEDMVSLYSELEHYVDFLFDAITEVINRNAPEPISPEFFRHMTRRGDTLLRALYYPALSEERLEQESVLWAAAHTDIDLLAILPYATEKGLQVEIDGKWLTVVVPEDAFIVNVGDMLENLSNGLFKSARHRVKALEPGKERFSMILFVHPMDDTPLDPLSSCIAKTGGKALYAPGTRKEFLWERLIELNIAPGLLEPYSKTGHVERQLQFGRESSQVVQLLIEHGLASQELRDALKEHPDPSQ